MKPPEHTPAATRVLFVCPNDSCWGQMAAGFALARQRPDADICCTGCAAGRIHPAAVKVMAEVGLDISGNRCRTVTEMQTPAADIIVELGGPAAGKVPFLACGTERVNWGLSDPADVRGEEATVLMAFRETRDRLRRLVDEFFDRGYFLALGQVRQCADVILNTISDGIIAHDLKRRIFYFNEAAERITGYRRDEVVGRDCHDVFPGNFCGGKCDFNEAGVIPEFEVTQRDLTLTTKSGEERIAAMTVHAMYDERRERIGVLASFRDLTEARTLARRLGKVQQFAGIIGRDAKMQEVFELIRELAATNVPVMIQGESGTGKELVAAAIHNEGPRAGKLFVPVNCGALPESLLESELFGHVRGAFTGAIRDKKGRFELADGGTIFLDEIGDITPAMQVKLLRVLQEGHFERVGSERTLKTDVRVISATNKNIAEEIATGRFREDLYYRLSVVPVLLPPLRERRNDLPLLADYLLRNILADVGRPAVAVSPEALDVMLSYDWPGNVRELQNWLQFALVKCRKDNVIRPEHLPPVFRGTLSAPRRQRARKLDVESVRAALRKTWGNKIEAARALGVSRATLYRFLDQFGRPA